MVIIQIIGLLAFTIQASRIGYMAGYENSMKRENNVFNRLLDKTIRREID